MQVANFAPKNFVD